MPGAIFNGRIVVHNSVGTVAAVLTAFEFVVGTVGLLCLAPFLHGLWLMRLHATGQATLRRSQARRWRMRREFAALLLSGWFAVSVALVEQALDTDVWIGPPSPAKTTSRCARLDAFYDAFAADVLSHPAHRFALDPWCLAVARKLRCVHGLQTVSFSDALADVPSTLAPACVPAPASTIQQRALPGIYDAKVNVHRFHFFNLGFSPVAPAFLILPYAGNLGRSRAFDHESAEEYAPLPDCARLNISAVPPRFVVARRWSVSAIDDYNISRVVLARLCTAISEPPPVLPPAVVTNALASITPLPAYGAVLNLPPFDAAVYSRHVDLRDVALLLVRDARHNDSRFASNHSASLAVTAVSCPDVALRVHYTLFPTAALTRALNARLVTPMSIPPGRAGGAYTLLPTRIEKLRGRCEPAAHVLGFSAALRGAYSEWTGAASARMNRRLRYRAYVLALARSFFNADDMRSLQPNMPCALRPVRHVTVVNKDWKLYVLLGIAAVNIMVAVTTAVFWAMFPAEAWRLSTSDPAHPSVLMLHRPAEAHEEILFTDGRTATPRHPLRNLAAKGIGGVVRDRDAQKVDDPEVLIQVIRDAPIEDVTPRGKTKDSYRRNIGYRITPR